MPQTYNFTVPSSSRAAERLAKDPASASGTVYEAIALALLYNVRVERPMKRGQVVTAIAAMERYADEQGAMDAVTLVRAALGTYRQNPRDGALEGGTVELYATIERRTGRRWQDIPADVLELYETHYAVTVATAPEELDKDGCPMGADLEAHGEFVRALALAV